MVVIIGGGPDQNYSVVGLPFTITCDILYARTFDKFVEFYHNVVVASLLYEYEGNRCITWKNKDPKSYKAVCGASQVFIRRRYILKIKAASLEDEGEWTCLLRNDTKSSDTHTITFNRKYLR